MREKFRKGCDPSFSSCLFPSAPSARITCACSVDRRSRDLLARWTIQRGTASSLRYKRKLEFVPRLLSTTVVLTLVGQSKFSLKLISGINDFSVIPLFRESMGPVWRRFWKWPQLQQIKTPVLATRALLNPADSD